MSLVQRHWETRLCDRSWPTGENCALPKIGDLDLLFVRHIHENASSCLLKLKRFGVGIHDTLPAQLSAGIQTPQSPGSLRPSPQPLSPAISDDYAMAAGVI